MNFRSATGRGEAVSFREALLQGIASDGGLFVPEAIPKLSSFLQSPPQQLSLHVIAREVASLFIEEIPPNELERVVQKALDFPIPLTELEPGTFLLELFHGPTLAFKDVGARFMAEVLSYFLGREERDVTIVVATSGDTGGAVAHGFHNVPHITVYILYPSGKISRLQEQQMTTLGGNINAVEVEGTFDDCQRLVKECLVDREVLAKRTLTTANSINLGRLLPQISYYAWGFVQWKARTGGEGTIATVVVPSGNFGNLTAAVYAKWTGVPIRRFVAATNVNDVVPEYFRTGKLTPRVSLPTLSNAMDVGNPSNLARLQALYANDLECMKRDIEAISISDEETVVEMQRTYERVQRIIDPHTAVGAAAARKLKESGRIRSPLIVAATAHPAKFPEVVKQALGLDIPLPPTLQEALRRPKQSIRIRADYRQWRDLLIS